MVKKNLYCLSIKTWNWRISFISKSTFGRKNIIIWACLKYISNTTRLNIIRVSGRQSTAFSLSNITASRPFLSFLPTNDVVITPLPAVCYYRTPFRNVLNIGFVLSLVYTHWRTQFAACTNLCVMRMDFLAYEKLGGCIVSSHWRFAS